MIYELNIGLDIEGCKSKGARLLRSGIAKSSVRRLRGVYDVLALRVIGDLGGADEPCLYAKVAVTDGEACKADIFQMSLDLSQDCIAVRYVDGKGELIGLRAAAWGEFNPEYFRQPDAAGLESVGIDRA